METICVDKSALKAVDDYVEYRRIVGDADGGKLFTPEQYEEYKRKVLPQRVKNRLYVSFGVPGGIDCKLIGPETQCFCTHRYKQHKTEFDVVPPERPLALLCRVRGCHCPAYQYVPLNGSQPVRCRCKHLPQDHSEATGHLCKKCSSCSGFQSPFTCGCGQPSSAHHTLVETKPEREARGRPVGRDVPYAAMGGLTGFSSLADGYLALEASGSDGPPFSAWCPEQSASFQPHVVEKSHGTTSPPSLTGSRSSTSKDFAYSPLKAEKMAARQRGSASRVNPASPNTSSSVLSKTSIKQ